MTRQGAKPLTRALLWKGGGAPGISAPHSESR